MHDYKNKILINETMKIKTKITFNSRFIKTTRHYSKFIILFSFLLIAFTVGDSRSEYIIPFRAYSISTSDIDLDEDKDIIVGNLTSWQQFNPTISILKNDSFGYFSIFDTSLNFCGYQKNIFATLINSDEFPDIVAFYSNFSSGDPERFIRILYNNNGSFYEYSDFSLNRSSTFTDINYGDVNGDNFNDIVVIINNDFQWGILYNDGTGNFSSPEYFNLDFPPTDIECADLNDDGRNDIVVTGSKTEIYFSTETGFQQQLLTETPSYGVLISDFDDDDDKDIILSTIYFANHHHVYFFENLGNNEFYEHDYFDFTPACSYTQIADFNNDSLPDMVFIADDNSGLYIYYNQGEFQLVEQQFIGINENNPFLQKVTCADFDNNSFNDIAIIMGFWGITPSKLIILFNDGDGNFVPDPITNITINNNIKKEISCFPNPFTSDVTFKLSRENLSDVNLSIYDIQGKKVFGLTNKNMKGGKNFIKWNGRDLLNKTVKPGMYFARFIINGTNYKSIKLIKY